MKMIDLEPKKDVLNECLKKLRKLLLDEADNSIKKQIARQIKECEEAMSRDEYQDVLNKHPSWVRESLGSWQKN